MKPCPTEVARQVELDRCAAFVAGDPAAIAGLLDDELRYTHSNGMVDTKASLLAMLATGAVRYRKITPDIRHAVPIGDNGAILTGILATQAVVGGESKDLVGRYTAVWRMGPDAVWRLVCLQGSNAVGPDAAQAAEQG